MRALLPRILLAGVIAAGCGASPTSSPVTSIDINTGPTLIGNHGIPYLDLDLELPDWIGLEIPEGWVADTWFVDESESSARVAVRYIDPTPVKPQDVIAALEALAARADEIYEVDSSDSQYGGYAKYAFAIGSQDYRFEVFQNPQIGILVTIFAGPELPEARS